jgi:uncharacterized protein (TIGR02266 family)
LKFHLPIDVRCGHSLFSARTSDVSEGGVFIKTRSHIHVGTEVELHLDLAGQAITVMGEVTWQLVNDEGEHHGIGVQFVGLTPFAKKAIRRFMSAHAPELYGAPAKVAAPPRPAPRSVQFDAIFRRS